MREVEAAQSQPAYRGSVVAGEGGAAAEWRQLGQLVGYSRADRECAPLEGGLGIGGVDEGAFA